MKLGVISLSFVFVLSHKCGVVKKLFPVRLGASIRANIQDSVPSSMEGIVRKWMSQISNILCIYEMWLYNTKTIFKTNYRILQMTLIKLFFCGSMMSIPPAKSDCFLFSIVFIFIEITLFEVFNAVGYSSFFKVKIPSLLKQTLLLI